MNENEKDDNRSFWRGLAVGLASSCAILLVVFGSVKIYQTYRVYGKLASGNSAETESVANEKTTEKLGVLENAIKQYLWQDVDESTLEEGVYKGLLESLDDPYSVYYTHDELVQLQQQTEGIYYGIGAYISQDNEMGYVRVSKIIKNTPAEASGLQQDDYIYKVDGEDMQGKDSSYALTEDGVTKATGETVAENASDGVIAPMLYMAIGGVWLMFLYKGINTMDSLLGYKNDKYLYFGSCAAKLDDVANYIPARLSGWLMVAASTFVKMDVKNAAKIYRRDRRNHASPNSAQTEAAMAGALEVQLAGNAYYFGKLYEKPTIGDGIRPVEVEDIRRSNRLLYATAILGAVIFLLIGSAVRYCFFL